MSIIDDMAVDNSAPTIAALKAIPTKCTVKLWVASEITGVDINNRKVTAKMNPTPHISVIALPFLRN